jgi:acyl-CoA synthetase (AMP-forming)/AMP-acid ligase II
LVRAAAVVGAPGPGAGEEVVAFVVSKGDLPHSELAQHCTSRLPPEKRPSRVYYLAHMPLTGSGKVDLAKLKALARSRAGGPASAG